MLVPARFSRRRRLSSAVEQRFCKPKVGGSIPSAGTTVYNDLANKCSPGFLGRRPRMMLGDTRGYTRKLATIGFALQNSGGVPW